MVKYGQTRSSVTDSAEHTDLNGVQAKKVHLFGRDNTDTLNDVNVLPDGSLSVFMSRAIPSLARANYLQNTVTISNSASETGILAGSNGAFNDLTKLIFANTASTPVRVDIRDASAGTVRESFYIPAGDTRGAIYGITPFMQNSVNSTWTAQVSASIVDMRISVQAIKNI